MAYYPLAFHLGGVVIVQVKRVALRGTLPPKQVKIPGMLVDFIVVDHAEKPSEN